MRERHAEICASARGARTTSEYASGERRNGEEGKEELMLLLLEDLRRSEALLTRVLYVEVLMVFMLFFFLLFI